MVKCIELQNGVHYVNSAMMTTQPASHEQLQVLSTVKEITGSLRVKSNDTSITDLSFLRNLRVIQGRHPE